MGTIAFVVSLVTACVMVGMKERDALKTWGAIVAGVVCGLVGCAAPAFLFEEVLTKGRRVQVSSGLVSIIVSFALMLVALFVVHAVRSELVLAFGCSMVATFLLFWGVESLRAWRAANVAPKDKGKDRG